MYWNHYWKKQKTKTKQQIFFSVVHSWWLYTYPAGLKRQKGSTESHLLLKKCRPILKWASKSSPYPLIDKRQYFQTNLIRAALIVLQHCQPWIKNVIFYVMFSCYCPPYKITKQKNLTRVTPHYLWLIHFKWEGGDGKWEFLTSKRFPCVFLAFVCPLPMCEG